MTDKLSLQSPDHVSDNFNKIAQLFPNCVTETAEGKAIDFDLLKQELSHAVVEGGKERYRLEWPGKREAIVTANLPTTKTLRPIRQDSADFDNAGNLYIEGDNLEVLKLLQESYLGKIKMIYIDPPYNTGNDFVYKDNFSQGSEQYKIESGQKGEYSQRLIANPETAGRYHSDWLTMMYPRLKLARNLLKEDGVIFISIDDNEVYNMGKICDEIFGESNFLANIIWQKKYSVSNDDPGIAPMHDFIVAYRKTPLFERNLLPRTEKQTLRYKNSDSDERGPWASAEYVSSKSKEERPTLWYPIIHPKTKKEVWPDEKAVWRYSKEKHEQNVIENRLYWGPSNSYEKPRLKRFLFEIQDGVVPSTWWPFDDVGHNDEGQKETAQLIGKKIFSTPKPVRLIERILGIASDKNDIILDFFSGSASTAHAVMKLNSQDGGNRKFIMVQLPEVTDEKSDAFKEGFKNICDIGKERIRRSGIKIKEYLSDEISTLADKLNAANLEVIREKTTFLKDPDRIEQIETQIMELGSKIETTKEILAKIDTGFRVYRLADSNMSEVYYKPQDYKQETLELFADNIKPDRTGDDLLAQVMLAWGLPLSLNILQANIDGKLVYKVGENSLYVCFDKGIDESFAKEIAKDQPLRIVFRDNGFKDDTAKINVKQLLKQLSPDTEMKVI